MMQGAVVTLDRETVDRLSAGLQGDLITPDDAGYDDARTLYNAMIDKHPALIVRCAHAADVAAVITGPDWRWLTTGWSSISRR